MQSEMVSACLCTTRRSPLAGGIGQENLLWMDITLSPLMTHSMMRAFMSKQLAMVMVMVITVSFRVKELRVRFDVISRIFCVELRRLV